MCPLKLARSAVVLRGSRIRLSKVNVQIWLPGDMPNPKPLAPLQVRFWRWLCKVEFDFPQIFTTLWHFNTYVSSCIAGEKWTHHKSSCSTPYKSVVYHFNLCVVAGIAVRAHVFCQAKTPISHENICKHEVSCRTSSWYLLTPNQVTMFF